MFTTLWTSRLIGFYRQPDHSFTHILRIISRTEKINNLLTIISNYTSHGSPSIYLISKEKAELKYVCPKMSHLQHTEIAFSVLHALVSSITRNHISAPLNQTSQPLNLILRSDTRARKRSSWKITPWWSVGKACRVYTHTHRVVFFFFRKCITIALCRQLISSITLQLYSFHCLNL